MHKHARKNITVCTLHNQHEQTERTNIKKLKNSFITHAFSTIVGGLTGFGKTTAVQNIIDISLNQKIWDWITVISPENDLEIVEISKWK